MSYRIQFLDDQEFDSLPYPEVETSLGLADPRTQTAYVRKTGVKPVDVFNAMHELEHLKDGHAGQHADHYRHGVYYKGLGEVFQSVLPAVGSLFGPIGGFLGSGISSLFGGGKGKEQQQQPSMGSSTPQVSAPQVSQPNVVMPQGGGLGGSPTGTGQSQIGKIKQYTQDQQDDQDSPFGRMWGR